MSAQDRVAARHGYGRYKDDPEHVGCPRAKSDMTPCIARDGALALCDATSLFPTRECVGCERSSRGLLRHLQEDVGVPVDAHEGTAAEVADRLRDLVRKVTEP